MKKLMPRVTPKILMFGANIQLARHATRRLLETPCTRLTLYLRRASRLNSNLVVKFALSPAPRVRQSLGVSRS